MPESLTELLKAAAERVKNMTPEEHAAMLAAQRESFLRGFGPCEHGVYDFETCAKCREKYSA